MSEKLPNENNNQQAAWRPLIPGQGNSSQVIDVESEKSDKSSHLMESFQPLYEGEEKDSPNQNDFSLIYTREEDPKKKSGTPAASTKPNDNNPEKKDKSTEHTENIDIQKIEREAHEKGFSLGKKDGFEAGMNEAKAAVDSLQNILTAMENLWPNMVSRYEKEILELVKRISEKVIFGNTRIDNEIVKRAILRSFELIPDPVDAVINVSSEDFEFIETIKDDIFDTIKSLKNVSVVSDPSLTRGGCRIETKEGEVDSDIHNRLDAISKSIIEAANEVAEEK